MSDTFIKIGASVVDAADYTIPSERVFREAWEISGSNLITIDMELAKGIWRDKIRQARSGKLEELDTAFMKALETSADTSAIVAQKQALRDAPSDPSIDAATTTEQLKAIQPAGLTIV